MRGLAAVKGSDPSLFNVRYLLRMIYWKSDEDKFLDGELLFVPSALKEKIENENFRLPGIKRMLATLRRQASSTMCGHGTSFIPPLSRDARFVSCTLPTLCCARCIVRTSMGVGSWKESTLFSGTFG